MTEPRWLLHSAVLAIHSMLLEEHGGASGARNEDMLSSALERAKNRFAYQPDSSLFELAAAYSFGIVKNHAFVDGNKRIAFLCGTLFLELNGLRFTAAEAEAAIVFENLAAGSIKEDELARWFEHHCEPRVT